MNHSISVILPTYNRAGLIEETIDSLLAQTRKPDEILVIDDGSTDGTSQVLARYDSLRIIRTENQGKASALNMALKMVTGDFVWIVDDDDLLLPDACMTLSRPLEADLGLGFCAGRHIDFEISLLDGRMTTREPGYMRVSAPEQIFPDLLEGCHIFQPGLMVRRSVYEAVGPFDTTLVRSQDYEMILRIARRFRGLQLADTVFLHREHAGTRGTAAESFSASENSDRWAAFNRIIFTRLLESLPDHEMIAQRDLALLPAALHSRAARIKRGCVLARQRMWPEAISAWQEASAMSPSPLSVIEREMLARSPNSAIGAPELFTCRKVRSELASLANMPSPGPEITSVISRSSLWYGRAAFKSRHWRRMWQVMRFQLQMRPLTAAVRQLGSKGGGLEGKAF
ncbi:glycosyltransferase family 2 protein [Paracoccus sp. (in: a-proteobacteria)]|uniref:glycosyltransferase family 2 protein n=1 Tax=Paracoccus sp. TaxID=267 RepID=UPI00396C70E4